MMEWLPRGLPSIHAPIPISVPPKAGQKRPTTSPAPLIPSPHHLQSPSGPTNSTSSSSATGPQSATSTVQKTSVLLNHGMQTNHIGAPTSANHQIHQQAVAAAAAAAQLSNTVPPGALNSSTPSARGPFAAALRNLAKQADSKEDDDCVAIGRDRNERVGSSAVSTGGAINTNTTVSHVSNSSSSRVGSSADRLTGSSIDERTAVGKKRSAPSPQPAEKIPRLNPSNAIQPDLLARSGFQPYRSDERIMHPAGGFPLDAYAPFAGLPSMPPGFLSPAAGLPYTDQLYLERYQMLRAAGAHHAHPHAALYPPMPSPYASHLYSMIPGAALGLAPAIHERLKLEEEHRARIAREEEREREMQREKERELREQREREQREKEQREREQREKEQREKEQKEKEAREREIREKEREARERERERQQMLATATHHYSNPLYSPLGRNLLGAMIPPMHGLRGGPPSGLHGLPAAMSPYHAAASQRQSPHHPSMGLNVCGIPGLTGVPSQLTHAGASSLPHHLQQATLGLLHPAAAGLTHPGFTAAAAAAAAHGLTHHSLNLTHPHISPHHPAITSTHQTVSGTPLVTSTAAFTSQAPTLSHSSNNSSPLLSSNVSFKHSIDANSISSSSIATSMAQTLAFSQAMAATTTPSTSAISNSHIPSMSSSLYYAHHHPSHHHLAAMHAAATAAAANALATTPVAAHQQNPSSLPSILTATNSGQLGNAHSNSPPNIKAAAVTPHSSSTGPATLSNAHNQNGGRASSSPHIMRHHIAAHQTTLVEKPSSSTSVGSQPQIISTPTTHEPTTLDLTGSNSNSSHAPPSTSTPSNSGASANNATANSTSSSSSTAATATTISHDVNGVEASGAGNDSVKDFKQSMGNNSKEDATVSIIAAEKKPPTPLNSNSSSLEAINASNSPTDQSPRHNNSRSATPASQLNESQKTNNGLSTTTPPTTNVANTNSTTTITQDEIKKPSPSITPQHSLSRSNSGEEPNTTASNTTTLSAVANSAL